MSPESLLVLGDRARLIQVVVNLLTNAAKYTPAGGRIELEVDVEAGQVRICVADNGLGIDAALLPHVFELFTQAERTPDRAQGGLGIGLALVRSIVQLHGGEVRARSPGAGRGSAFTVLLPRIAQPSAPEEAARPPEPGGTRRRVLVVDDNHDAAEMTAALLTVHGHAVAIAHTGADALDSAAAGTPFDAYVLDIGLPDLTGYELARRLRAIAPNARFVALTGYGQQQDREAALAAGFDAHLVKPADAPSLLASL